MNEPAIVISSLIKRHPNEAVSILDKVSMSIPKERITLIIGENGCGKSTLLNCISGLLPFNSGSIQVSINGQVNYKLIGGSKQGISIENRKKVGVIFQQKALWPHMTVYDNLSHPLRKVHMNLDERMIEDRVNEYLEKLGLDKAYLKKYPLELSGGQQRKVAIARTLAIKPELLIIDELEANLDQSSLEQVLNVIDEDFLKRRKTVLMITHRAELIERFAPYIIALYPSGGEHGKVITANNFEDLFQKKYDSESTGNYIKKVIDPARSQWYFGNQCLETATKISSLNLNETDEQQLFLDLGKELSQLIEKLESDSSHLLLIATKVEGVTMSDFKIRSAEISSDFKLDGHDIKRLESICEGNDYAPNGVPLNFKFRNNYKQIIQSQNGISLTDGKGQQTYNGLIEMMFKMGWKSWAYKNTDNSEAVYGAFNISIPIQPDGHILERASYNEFSKNTNNVYLIAIKIGEEIKGVISIDTTSKKKWSNFVMEQLILIANMAAIALKQREELEKIKVK